MISSLEENLMPRDDIFGESRQLLLVKHFLDEGGDYEENDDFIQYTGHNLGCSLFSMLPEFFEGNVTKFSTNGEFRLIPDSSGKHKPGCQGSDGQGLGEARSSHQEWQRH